jgi:EEF1A N-terminal glycine/lysine methyltransferase
MSGKDNNVDAYAGGDYVVETLFEESLGMLFSDVSFAHGNPGGVYVYDWPEDSGTTPTHLIDPKHITLKLPSSIDTNLFAHYVWNAGIFLADHIAAKKLPLPEDFELIFTKGCVELGAGTGLPSIALISLLVNIQQTEPKVVITDYNDEALIATIRENIVRNLKPQAIPYCKLIGHTWATPIDPVVQLINPNHSNNKFGIIMMADTIWERLNHNSLLISCDNLLEKDGVIYLSFCNHHSGGSQPEEFLNAASSAPFHFTFEMLYTIPIPIADCNPFYETTSGESNRRYVNILRGKRKNQ